MSQHAESDDLELLGLLLAEDGAEVISGDSIPRRPTDDPIEPSAAQRRLWAVEAARAPSPAYTIAQAVRIEGPLDPTLLQRALAAVVDRHEALRCGFATDAEGALCVALTAQEPTFSFEDLSSLAPVERDRRVRRRVEEAAARAFSIDRPPLVAVDLLRLGRASHVAALALHHIVADGWSMGVLVRELSAFYQAFAAGQPAVLPDLPVQYPDFAAWQNGREAEIATQREFWRNRLADLPPLELTTDRPRPAVQSYEGSTVSVVIPSAVTGSLRALSRHAGASSFMVLLAAFHALLGRWTGQQRIAVGSPMANRNRLELENLIGFFVNPLVLDGDLSGSPTFRELVERTRDRALEAFANQDVPFDSVVEAVSDRRTPDRNPLFQVLFALQNAPVEAFSGYGLRLEPIETSQTVSKFDLSLILHEDGDQLTGGIEYATALFDQSTVERLADHYQRLLAAVAQSPDVPLASLDLTSSRERADRVAWNRTQRDYEQISLAELFEAAVDAYPDAEAYRFDARSLTYTELNRQANRLAHHLRSLGVGRESRVGVSTAPGYSACLAMLAIIKAGGAYVPITPAEPAARRDRMAGEADVAWVVTEADLPTPAGARRVSLDRDAEAIAAQSSDNPAPLNDPDDLAYVIYTSGSTGRPKGVAVPHRAVARLVRNTNFATFDRDTRIAQISNYGFDAITFELWGAWLNGGVLIGVGREDALSPRRLASVFRQEKVTSLFMTAALFNQVVAEVPAVFAGMRDVLVGGEALDPLSVARALETGSPANLINGYGPTESTTFAVTTAIDAALAARERIPIGRPIANTTAHVVGPHAGEQPIGVPGELLLGGDGLARGYINDARLTAERFVPDPFSKTPGARLYRTGDRVRRLADGAIDFLGRTDGQVKLRGFRIELGEVEAALRACPGIAASAAVIDAADSAKRLLAFVSPQDGADLRPAEIRDQLRDRVPSFMIPAVVRVLDRLPLNKNGKLDKQALLALGAPDSEPGGFVASQGDREEAVAEIWRGLLKRDRIGRFDNFFELGGDSITAIQAVSRLRVRGWLSEVPDLYAAPTVAGLAARLRAAQQTGGTAPEPEDSSPIPLTAVQRWFFAEHQGPLHQFNQSVLLTAEDGISQPALERALGAVVSRHAMLCARRVAGSLEIAEQRPTLELHDLTDQPATAVEPLADAAQASLDLEHGPVFRALLFRTAHGDRLLLVAHHLVIDGVSWRILLEDLAAGYAQAERGDDAIDLGPSSASFAAWARAVETFAQSEDLLAEADYWGREVATVEIPRETDPDANTFGAAHAHTQSFNEHETAQLLTEANRAFHTDAEDLLLAALGRAVGLTFGGPAIWISLEGHGRQPLHTDVDLTRTIGWFTSIYPFALESGAGRTRSEHLVAVKEARRAVPRKGVGYGILRYVTPRQPDIDWPQPRLSFNYLGRFDDAGDAGRFRFAAEGSGREMHPDLTRAHDIDVVASVSGGRLHLTVHYLPGFRGTVIAQHLATAFAAELRALLTECVAAPGPVKTASDLAVPGLTQPALERLREGQGWSHSAVQDAYPLSPLQSGLLYETLADSESQAYFVQVSYRLRGALDLAAFHRAWADVVGRHPILRTAFIEQEDGVPLQVVLNNRSMELEAIDLTRSDDPESALDDIRVRDRARGFAVDQPPLMRVKVARLSDDLHAVIWSHHHLLLDGWCLGVLHAELIAAYQARISGEQAEFEPPVPYGDFVRWLSRWDHQAARAFWRDKLAGFEDITSVPVEGPGGDPLPEDYRFHFGARTTSLMRQAAADLGVTLGSLVMAVWGLLLARYNDADDVLFGTVASGRPADLPGVERIMGPFINAIPVRVTLAEKRTFADLARSLMETAWQPHQYLPLTEIQAGRPLFDHLLSFENFPLESAAAETAADDGPGFRMEGDVEAHDRTHYDFNLVFFPGDQLDVKIGYNAAKHPREQIERITGHWRHVMEAVLADPACELRSLDVMPAAEQAHALALSAGPLRQPTGLTIPQQIRRQAERTPHAPAVSFDGRDIPYHELIQRVRRRAAGMAGRGIARGDRVAVVLNRSDELVVTVLAILEAGCAFVPIDPATPDERVRLILEDARVRFVVREDTLGRLDATAVPESPGATLGDVAYAIYTSGSTGKPKGCVVDHNNLAHYLEWASEHYYPDAAGGSFPLYTPLSFDLTITSLFLPLIRGGMVQVFPQDAGPDEVLRDVFSPHSRVDSVKLTPAHIELLAHLDAAPQNLRVAIVGGEALSPERGRLLAGLSDQLRVYNEYGPTETTVGVIVEPVSAQDERILIGRPIANARAYIVDRDLRLCPNGAPGEILIAGAGVARGYLGRPELNQEKFIADPFHPGARAYRSGDIGRRLNDGRIEYLGRRDEQLKIRGYRIEPAEIESALLACSGVTAATAFPNDERTELVAFYTGALDPADLLTQLGAALPAYMIPATLERVAEIPLTANGKVDRRALAAAAPTQQPVQRGPRDAVEQRIAEAWRDVLGLDEIDIDTSFFALGGHSLKMMQAASRLRRTLGVELTLRDFLRNPTIATLADAARQASSALQDDAIPPAPGQDDYPLSYAQQRLWMIDRMGGVGAAYNMPKALVLNGPVDASALERALATLVERHEALRTAFVEVDGEPRQRILPRVPLSLEYSDVSAEFDPRRTAAALVDADAHQTFDLSSPPLLRARLIRLAPERHVFGLVLHHIIGDGWSMNVVYDEVLALYEGFRQGRPHTLPPLPIQYKDFAWWQRSQSVAEQERYWLDRLAGAPESLRLPYDRAPSGDRDFRGATVSATLDAACVEGLRAFADARLATLSNAVLAVFEAFLFVWTKQEDFVIGVSVAGRNRPELESLVGFFVNLLPIRARLSGEMEFADILDATQQASEEAFERQDYPFDRLVEALNPERRANRQPLLNVVYAFQNFSDVGSSPQGQAKGPEDLEVEFRTSKFDLTLFVTQEPRDTLRLTLEYDTGLFDRASAERAVATVERFARAAADSQTQAAGNP